MVKYLKIKEILFLVLTLLTSIPAFAMEADEYAAVIVNLPKSLYIPVDDLPTYPKKFRDFLGHKKNLMTYGIFENHQWTPLGKGLLPPVIGMGSTRSEKAYIQVPSKQLRKFFGIKD